MIESGPSFTGRIITAMISTKKGLGHLRGFIARAGVTPSRNEAGHATRTLPVPPPLGSAPRSRKRRDRVQEAGALQAVHHRCLVLGQVQLDALVVQAVFDGCHDSPARLSRRQRHQHAHRQPDFYNL